MGPGISILQGPKGKEGVAQLEDQKSLLGPN